MPPLTVPVWGASEVTRAEDAPPLDVPGQSAAEVKAVEPLRVLYFVPVLILN